jgi:hypothetical protein
MGRRQEQVAQVADRVMLDVMHVAQRAERFWGQRLILEVIELDVCKIQATCACFVRI